MVFFPEKGEEIKTSFWHIWIAQWLKFFRTAAYFFFFSILAIFRRKREVKVRPKVLTLGPSLFHKYSNPSKKFSVFLLKNYPWWEFRQCWTISGRVRVQKPLKKSHLVDAESVCKILKFIIEQPQLLYRWNLPQLCIFMRV